MAIIVGGKSFEEPDHTFDFYWMGRRATKKISRKKVLYFFLAGTILAMTAGFVFGLR